MISSLLLLELVGTAAFADSEGGAFVEPLTEEAMNEAEASRLSLGASIMDVAP